MRIVLAIAFAAGAIGFAAARPAVAADGAAEKPAAKKPLAYVVIFDFACKDGGFGKQVADSARLRLARHEEYDVVDGLTTADASPPLPLDAPRDKVAKLMERLACTIAVYGAVTKSGDTFKAEVRVLDLTIPDRPGEQLKTFTNSTERARGELAREIVQAVTGQAEWIPPQYGDEKEPDAKALGKPENANGDFEDGAKHWDHPDNAGTFVEKGPEGRGNILRVQTDLLRDPWLEYTRNIRLGLADPDKPPRIPRDTGYDSVAGLEGVHFRSEWIKAVPGQRYWMLADHKGPGGAKVFLKGYRDMSAEADGLPEVSMVERKLTPEAFAKMAPDQQRKLMAEDAKAHPERYRRECYRWYLNCDTSGNQWKHFAAPVPPRGGLPKNVEWLQIQIYSYWPPGAYLWDNVFLYKDPTQKAPLPEEPARTPNFGPAGATDPSSQPAGGQDGKTG
ncbi:MAG: hypothetical protein ACE15C_08695 [Phycisphaerae bacterium]